MNKFEVVPYEQFHKAMLKAAPWYTQEQIRDLYSALKCPRRATKGSAGYDFFAPFPFYLKPGGTALIPTGIRAVLQQDRVLMLFPRSGMGFKYRFQLDNTVGIIDSDYYLSDNAGQIMAKVTNDGSKSFDVKQGEAFMQGVILPYLMMDNDDADGVRNGGFGSTST